MDDITWTNDAGIIDKDHKKDDWVLTRATQELDDAEPPIVKPDKHVGENNPVNTKISVVKHINDDLNETFKKSGTLKKSTLSKKSLSRLGATPSGGKPSEGSLGSGQLRVADGIDNTVVASKRKNKRKE